MSCGFAALRSSVVPSSSLVAANGRVVGNLWITGSEQGQGRVYTVGSRFACCLETRLKSVSLNELSSSMGDGRLALAVEAHCSRGAPGGVGSCGSGADLLLSTAHGLPGRYYVVLHPPPRMSNNYHVDSLQILP